MEETVETFGKLTKDNLPDVTFAMEVLPNTSDQSIPLVGDGGIDSNENTTGAQPPLLEEPTQKRYVERPKILRSSLMERLRLHMDSWLMEMIALFISREDGLQSREKQSFLGST